MALTGCKVYDPSLVDRPDAGVSCGDAVPPPRPAAPDDGIDVGEVTFALRDVLLDQSGEQWRDIGLNLDGLCTQAMGDPVECVPPRPTAMSELDGHGGIDNAFGDKLYPVVQLILTSLQEDARAAQAAGQGALLVRVHGWNGTDNDSEINVVISQSAFGTPCDPDGTPPDDVMIDGYELKHSDGSPADPPAWDTHDCWWAREDTFLRGDPEQPLVRDDRAYVSNRQAVMRLPDRVGILFFAGDQSVMVRLTDARAIGRLSDDGTVLENATVTGRWSIIDLIETAARVGVCDGSAEMRILVSQLETIADVRSTPGTGGPGVDCDALSLGVVFRGVLGTWVGLAPAPPPPDACMEGDAGVPTDAGTGVDAGVDGG